MWEEICQDPLALHPTYLIFRGKKQMQFPLYPFRWGLGLFCSPLKEMIFQQLTPSSDYYPAYTLCCDPLVVLMVHRLIFLGGCFPHTPKPPLPSESLLEWKIDNANNPFQSVLIANYCFRSVHQQISPPHLPPSF